MNERSFSLESDERVVFEMPEVVVTNRRLLANFGRLGSGDHDAAFLSDMASPQKKNGGQRSRMHEGIRFFGLGGGLLVIEIFLESSVGIDMRIATGMFGIGSIGFLVGVYFILTSLTNAKPNTTLMFPILDDKDIIVAFPGWDNTDADEVMLQFARAKRGL